VTDLEQDLRDVGALLLFPGPPDLWPGISDRLGRRRRPRVQRLAAALAALAALATAFGVALAVPPARSAILRLLHLDGVSIVRVERLPALPPRVAADLGSRSTLAVARPLVPFTIIAPQGRRPDAVYVGEDVPPAVTLVYGPAARPLLLLTEFRPCCGQDSVRKEVPSGVVVQSATVHGSRAIWIGGRHAVRTTRLRRAGSTLIWERDDVVYRLEAELDEADAVRLAEGLEPIRTGRG